MTENVSGFSQISQSIHDAENIQSILKAQEAILLDAASSYNQKIDAIYVIKTIGENQKANTLKGSQALHDFEKQFVDALSAFPISFPKTDFPEYPTSYKIVDAATGKPITTLGDLYNATQVSLQFDKINIYNETPYISDIMKKCVQDIVGPGWKQTNKTDKTTTYSLNSLETLTITTEEEYHHDETGSYYSYYCTMNIAGNDLIQFGKNSISVADKTAMDNLFKKWGL
jgi:hypothetical protein